MRSFVALRTKAQDTFSSVVVLGCRLRGLMVTTHPLPKLAFLEQFFGEGFNGVDGPNPNNTAAPLLKELYADLVRDMEAGLLAQTHLKPFFEHVEYKVTEPEKDAEGNVVKPGRLDILMDPALAWLGETAKTDPRTALEQLWGLKKMMADDLACAA